MSIDLETAARVAKLARIRVEEDRLPALAQEFNTILGFIEQLGEVDVEEVEPMTSVTPQRLKRRDDVVTDGHQADNAREIVEAGGSRVETFLGVLFLSHRGHVVLHQDDLFGDLWIRNPAAVKGTDEAIAMATMYVANHLDVRAIASLTESGSTPLWMSRISSGIPIYALTRHERTARRVSLYRGVYPVSYPIVQVNPAEANRAAVEVLVARGAVSPGDRVIITKGDLMGVHGGTNSMKIVEIGADGSIDVPDVPE